MPNKIKHVHIFEKFNDLEQLDTLIQLSNAKNYRLKHSELKVAKIYAS